MSNFTDKAMSVLRAVAPVIAIAVGGPFGAAAAGVLTAVLGTSDPAKQEAALLQASPETLAAIRKADEDFQATMAGLKIKEEQLVYDDRASARSRENTVKDTTPRNLAYMVLAGTGLAIGAVLMGWAKVEGALAGTLIGYMVAESRSALSYYFGAVEQIPADNSKAA